MLKISRIHIFITLVCATAFVLSAQPKIQLNKTVFDLGTIYQGEIRNVPLVVKNSGNQPLRILGVETSCGCTTAKRSEEPILPGTVDTIVVSFNSLGFSGSITKIVTVASDDPAAPMMEARLTGSVTSVLEIVPPMSIINFGSTARGTSIVKTFFFKNTTKENFTIHSISSADSAVKALPQTTTVNPSDSVSIQFTIAPRTTSFMDNYFYIETTHPRQQRIPFRYMYIGR
ncbi:MAG: DUF1573 domain-containing protein [Bacteroidota bacterium]